MSEQDDIQAIVDYCRGLAEKLLEEYQEYAPFAAYIDVKGTLRPSAYYDENATFPEDEEIVLALETSLSRNLQAKEIWGYGIARDTVVERGDKSTKAVALMIRHLKSSRTVTYYIPYKVGAEQEIQFGEVFTTEE